MPGLRVQLAHPLVAETLLPGECDRSVGLSLNELGDLDLRLVGSDYEQGEIGPDLYRHACLLGLYRAGRSPNWVKVWIQRLQPCCGKTPSPDGGNAPADPSARSPGRQRTWHIWFDDVRVGTMGAFAGLRGSMQRVFGLAA